MDTKAPTIPTNIASDTEPPKKFIRTFESDMATLKKGGVPELAPFTTPPPTTDVQATPTDPSDGKPHTIQGEIEKSIQNLAPSNDFFTIESLTVPVPIPLPLPPVPTPIPEKIEPPPLPPPPPIPEPEPLPEPEIVVTEEVTRPNPAQTYASDFSERIKETNASALTVLAAQQDSKQIVSENKEQVPASPHRTLYIVLSILLLLVGGVSVYFTYMRYRTNTGPVAITPTVAAPIFVDERTQLSGTDSALLQAIQESIAAPVQGGVRLLYLANATSTDNNIFLELHLSAPDILLRNVDPLGGMTGIVNVNGAQSPFFILAVDSYSDTFAGMLSWEIAMPRTLAAFFPPYPAPVLATSTIATTTKSTTKTKTTLTSTVPTPVLVVPQGFHDEVISNHDVRIFSSPQGQDIMVYGYWNQTTLVIARDTAAFTAILQRLATSRTQ